MAVGIKPVLLAMARFRRLWSVVCGQPLLVALETVANPLHFVNCRKTTIAW